ncbi:MAG: MBL fold metallo-hydrolase [Bdellovibrionota bacterium]
MTQQTSADELRISRILHAGYLFESGGTRIAFDPIFENPFSRNCYAFPEVRFDHEAIRKLEIDAVFISHFHDDHCSFDSLDLLDRGTPIFLFCVFPRLAELVRALGFENVHSLEIDAPVSIGSFEIVPKRALDAEIDSILHVKAAGFDVLNVVDSWIDDVTLTDLASVEWDMILWPFQTMRELEVLSPAHAAPATGEIPHEWIEQLQVLYPRYVVPSSCQLVHEPWSWYNRALFPITYAGFQQQVEAAIPGSRVVRLNPSVSVALRKNEYGETFLTKVEPLPWIEPIGPQDVDYDYEPDLVAPPTFEITKHFPALTDDQAKLAFDFCKSGLLTRYRELGTPDDEFFEGTRRWRLTVFDHHGAKTDFDFEVKGDTIEPLDVDEARSYEWSTEIPLFKLHSALTTGESLTSMYLRISRSDFDVLEDPLVRCLFDGEFAGYQAAQLKRLQNRGK